MIFPSSQKSSAVCRRSKITLRLIYHWREHEHEKFFAGVKTAFASYRETMEEDRRLLLDHYELCDIAIKVVGVGSVGTWCGIVLLLASETDPLFLQVKEAGPSVLEAYAGKSIYPNHGQRVVNGCRLMQSASDLFLGWTVGPTGRQLYVRQLKDMKIKHARRGFQSHDYDAIRRVVRMDPRTCACPLR